MKAPSNSIGSLMATIRKTDDSTLLEELANSTDPNIRRAIACHNYTPEHVLNQLINDIDLSVRYMAVLNLFSLGKRA